MRKHQLVSFLQFSAAALPIPRERVAAVWVVNASLGTLHMGKRRAVLEIYNAVLCCRSIE